MSLRSYLSWSWKLSLLYVLACGEAEPSAPAEGAPLARVFGTPSEESEPMVAKILADEAESGELEAPDGVWTYFEFPDTRCRDGSPAGVSLRKNSKSSKLLIYLEGGVYCFDALSCLVNPVNVDNPLFNSPRRELKTGIFDRNNPDNPVRDWNIAYVPYCTGDGHAGSNEQPVRVPGVLGAQRFVGQLNLQKFLRRVVPTFADASDVLLTGISAGGFGVMHSASLVQAAFPRVKVKFVNDSGIPPLSERHLPACLQEELHRMWRLDRGSLAACGPACADPRSYMREHALFLAEQFADRPVGFINAIDDLGRMLYGFGANDCRGGLLTPPMSSETYRDELLAYRDALEEFPNFGTFYPQSTQHIWLRDDTFYTVEADGVRLRDWFASIVDGESAGHAGP
jgi:hypothetical protein